MKKSTLFYSSVIASIATFFVVIGWGCYEALREAAFICILPALPAFPFTWIADLLQIEYNAPFNWPLAILGTFITWFVLGFIAKSIIDVIRDK